MALGLSVGGPASYPNRNLFPTVSGNNAFGIFMGNQDSVEVAANRTMALLGGTMVIDPATPATQTAVSAGLSFDVEGKVGAQEYCDAEGNDCFLAADATGLWSPDGTNNYIEYDDTLGGVRIGKVTGQPAPATDWNLDITNSIVYTASNTVAIGSSSTATGGDQDLELDVAGDIGADNYCDSAGDNCFTASDVSSIDGTLIQDADGNTSVKTEESANEDIIRFDTAGTERMVIDENGNVGIGTDTPADALDVQGSIRASGHIYVAGKIRGNTDWDDFLDIEQNKFSIADGSARNPHYFTFENRGSGDLGLLIPDGNVGIGDSSPDGTLKLDVEGKVGATEYCDENGANCVAAAALGGASELNDLSDAYTDYATDNNIIVGDGAGVSVAAGAQNNTIFGQNAFAGVTTADADSNTAFGWYALKDNTSGRLNTAIGRTALAANTSGQGNTAVGMDALKANEVGTRNTAIGQGAALENVDGSQNIAIGRVALRNNVSGDNNLAIGLESLNLSTGSNNIALGFKAGDNITTGSNNIIIGYDIDAADPAGDDQLNIGDVIVAKTDIATTPVATGVSAIAMGTGTVASGDKSFAMGHNTTASGNFSVALGRNTTASGVYSIATGDNAAAPGPYSVAMGHNTTASGSTSVSMGVANKSIGYASTTMGRGNTASGLASAAIGQEVKATGTENTFAIGLSDQTDTDADRPQVSGSGSFGIFMDTADNYDLSATDQLAIIGGELMIDTDANATDKGCIRFNDTSDALEFSNDCTTYDAIAGISDLGTIALGDLSDAYTDYATDNNIIVGDGAGVSVAAGAQNNTIFGQGAFASGATTNAADLNTAFGYATLASITSGWSNTAVGHRGLGSLTSGAENIAMGRDAAYSSTTAQRSVALGHAALYSNTTAWNNIAIGYRALHDTQTGGGNIGIGSDTLYNNNGARNVAIGSQALNSTTTGENNIALGHQAGDNITTGSNNIIIGYDIDAADPAGDDQLNIGDIIRADMAGDNVYLGQDQDFRWYDDQAHLVLGRGNSGKTGQIMIYGGDPASKVGFITHTGGNFIFDGGTANQILKLGGSATTVFKNHIYQVNTNTTGNDFAWKRGSTTQMALDDAGALKLYEGQLKIDGGAGNEVGCIRFNDTSDALEFSNDCTTYDAIAGTSDLGTIALGDLSDAYTDYATDNNIIVGDGAGVSVAAGAQNNTIFGQNAFAGVTTADADLNTAFGYNALAANSSGTRNAAVGNFALRSNTTGNRNAGFGHAALQDLTTGNYNTAIGQATAANITEGNENTAVGRFALGASTTGSNNIALGYHAGDNITTGSNNIIIGYDIDAADPAGDDQLNIGDTIYGDLSTGKVSIGTTDVFGKLTLEGDLNSTPGDETILTINRMNNNTGNGGFIGFNRWTGTTPFVKIGAEKDDPTNTGAFTIHTGGDVSATVTERMRVSGNGNVGIGTSTPQAKLETTHTDTIAHSSANIANAGLLVTDGGSHILALDSNEIHQFGARLNLKGEEGIRIAVGDVADGDYSEVMHFTPAGNVGIGTDAPVGLLDVSSGTAGDAELYIQADTDNNNEDDNPRIIMRQDGGSLGVNIGFDEANYGLNTFGITRRHAATNYYDGIFYKAGTGKVGIGTSTPETKMHVQGDARFINTSVPFTSTAFTTGEATVGRFHFVSSPSGATWSNPHRPIVAIDDTGSDSNIHGCDGCDHTGLKIRIDNERNTSDNVGLLVDATGGAANVAGWFRSGDVRISAGDLTIGTNNPSGTLKLDVEGKVGATEYCDENGANCVAAAALGGGSSVWTDNTSHASFGGFHVLKAGQALPATFDDNGTRAFYYHDKEAFRGGEIKDGNDAWQEANIGTRSFAWGRNVQATGDSSTATGSSTTASGVHSAAIGRLTSATGETSTAMGYQTTASGNRSTALGFQTTAFGWTSTAMGHLTTASGYHSTAMGYQTTASGSQSTAMGRSTTASGDSSTAMGHHAHAGSYGETSIGLYADDTVGDLSASVLTDVLFEIGNGTATNARSNAMTVLKNGNVGIGTSTPQATLETTHTGTIGASSANIGNAGLLVTDGGSQILAIDSNEIHQFGHSLYLRGENGVRIGVGDNADGDYSEVMHFTPAGNVGIGTSTPGAKLDVAGSIRSTGFMFTNANGDEWTLRGTGNGPTIRMKKHNSLDNLDPCKRSGYIGLG